MLAFYISIASSCILDLEFFTCTVSLDWGRPNIMQIQWLCTGPESLDDKKCYHVLFICICKKKTHLGSILVLQKFIVQVFNFDEITSVG